MWLLLFLFFAYGMPRFPNKCGVSTLLNLTQLKLNTLFFVRLTKGLVEVYSCSLRRALSLTPPPLGSEMVQSM
jgi:hypothetical protein